jgi:hypothetical protein
MKISLHSLGMNIKGDNRALQNSRCYVDGLTLLSEARQMEVFNKISTLVQDLLIEVEQARRANSLLYHQIQVDKLKAETEKNE